MPAPVWKGYVVARNLPLDLDPNYSQQRKKVDRQIDPSEILSCTGPLHYPIGWHRALENMSTAVHTDGVPLESVRQTDLWIYLHQTETFQTISIQLQRDAQEPLVKTLQRMHLNLAKKLQSLLTGKRNATRAKNARETIPAVWTLNIQSGTLQENIDVRDISIGDFCAKATTLPLSIVFVIPDVIVEPLFVDACPPTVTGVQTFHDFEAYMFPQVPITVKVDLLFCTHAIIDWYVDGIIKKCDSPLYIPSVEDIGKRLSVMIRPVRENHDGRGHEEAYRFLRDIQPLPPNLFLGLRPDWTIPRESSIEIRVLTYNTLADQNCSQDIYPYCKAEYLLKHRRLPLVAHEILAYQPDVVCLQEVDEHIYARLFQPIMSQYNYDGHFAQKRSDGQTEGCALFWNRQRFHQGVKCRGHVLRDQFPFATSGNNDINTFLALHYLLERRNDLKEILRNRLGHIVQIVCLLDSVTGQKVWVCNTHLFYHSQGTHIRALQMWALCHRLIQSMKEADNCSTTTANIIICGDFNSSLENSCGKLLVDGCIPQNFRDTKYDLNNFVWERELRNDNNLTSTFDDDFPAICLPKSFPRMHRAISPAPQFTHMINGFKGDLDHIIISSGLRVTSSAPMPDLTHISEQTAMPDETMPSDHISLVCDIVVPFIDS